MLLVGPVAVAAVLLWLRSRDPHGLLPGVDRVGARLLAVLVIGLAAGWPTATLRGWLGYVSPAICLDKARALAPPDAATTDIDQMKAQVRAGALDRGPALDLEAVDTAQVQRVTGAGSSGETAARWNVVGTDLGHPFVLDGRLGLVFGDTFEVEAPSGPGWRSNVLAWVDDHSPGRLVITDMHEARPGQAGELIGSLKLDGWEQTVIPTDSIAVDDRIVLHVMSIACWGQPGTWVVRRSGLVVSDDGGESFHRVPTARWPAGSGFAQVAFVPGDDWIHVFGLPEGRDGPARLARVRPNELLDGSAWRYWDGEDWSPRESDAVQVVGPPIGELSVAWNPHHQRWLMLYLDLSRGGVVMRTADELTGPWSRARLVVSQLEVPALYAPYLLPGTGQDDIVEFTMSRFDIYNVVLMRTRLVPR